MFQIGGAGAVGTGSIRGMPHLLTLADSGFTIWPFVSGGLPTVVEIYPRALTGPVNKGSHGISSNARPAPRTRSMQRYRPL